LAKNGVEIRIARNVFTTRQGHRRLGFKRAPLMMGRIGGQGFFQPDQTGSLDPLGKGLGGLNIPSLVGIGRQRFMRAHAAGQIKDRRDVIVQIKPDLDLETGKSRIAGAVDLSPGGPNVYSAGVNRHVIPRAFVHKSVHRQPSPAREQIPQGDIEPGNHLAKGAEFATLQCAQSGCRTQVFEQITWRMCHEPKNQIAQIRLQKVHPMLGPGGRPIGKYLAPAETAVAVFNPDKYRRTVPHDAKRCGNRCLGRATHRPGLNTCNLNRAFHVFAPFATHAGETTRFAVSCFSILNNIGEFHERF